MVEGNQLAGGRESRDSNNHQCRPSRLTPPDAGQTDLQRECNEEHRNDLRGGLVNGHKREACTKTPGCRVPVAILGQVIAALGVSALFGILAGVATLSIGVLSGGSGAAFKPAAATALAAFALLLAMGPPA